MALDLTTANIDKNPDTPFYFPQGLSNCVMKVLQGEYLYTSMPDEPKIRRVLDVGGNVGAFAAWIYKRYGGRPWIDGYEPHPVAADLYERNAPPGAVVHRVAVTSQPGPVKLNVGADLGQSSLFKGCSVLTGETIEVPTIHPKDLPPCDLLKIDIEGGEGDVLTHYPHLSKTAVVMLEWHTQALLFECEALCRAAGLTLVKSVLDRADLGLQVWVRTCAKYDIDRNQYLV